MDRREIKSDAMSSSRADVLALRAAAWGGLGGRRRRAREQARAACFRLDPEMPPARRARCMPRRARCMPLTATRCDMRLETRQHHAVEALRLPDRGPGAGKEQGATVTGRAGARCDGLGCAGEMASHESHRLARARAPGRVLPLKPQWRGRSQARRSRPGRPQVKPSQQPDSLRLQPEQPFLCHGQCPGQCEFQPKPATLIL